jgi:Tol biopolymer transport system component
MKWLDRSKMRIVLIGFIFTLLLCGENTNADFTFGTPTNLGPPFNSSRGEFVDCISADGLELYGETINWPGGYGDWDLWVARRSTIDDDWGAPENLGSPVNSSSYEVCAYISADGLSLYFGSGRPGGYGGADLWVTKRPTKDDDWGQPENLGSIVNSAAMENGSWISPDGLELYFDSNREGGFGSVDIWITKRATKDDLWGEPENLGSPVNSSSSEVYPFVSTNGLLLLFSDVINGPIRAGGFGDVDMWMAMRASVNDSWGIPVNMGPMVNTSSIDSSPRISPDGSMLYFSSERPGGLGGHYGDIYKSPIIPIVDLNGDGIVDAADMCIIVDHWGENYSLCDIGPTPLGDGIVDVQDLIVLAEHLFEEIFPPELIAYWKLDEVEGKIAHNSISDNHGILSGNPTWQPDIGHVAGALGFDGIDDYISTDFVLNPTDGAFSVFAWIKGGAPGQVILSQTDGPGGTGEIWLGADTLDGKLMTGLRPPSGRSPTPPMVADIIITDGQWYHVGIVVTEQKVRHLYVDGIRAAFDTQPVVMPSSDGGLHMGSDKTLGAGTLFSGLIDDVRIYNVALSTDKIAALAQ